MLTLWMVAAPAAWPQEAEAPPVPAEQVRVVTFEDDLSVGGHMMLQGVTAYGSVTFTRPRGWDLTEDPALDLRFEHSAALLPEHSFLTVHLNDQPVGTVGLTADNAIGGQLSVTLPRSLVEDHNRLSFVADQSYTLECEDPFDPALWTRVSDQSSIRFTYQPIPVESQLLDLPYPMVDTLGYGAAQLALVGPETVSEGDLTALATLGLTFGRQAAWHHVQVTTPAASLDKVNSNAIVLGTVSGNPLVNDLVDTSDLRDGQGLVALVPNPWNPTYGVLVVTGRDDAGVLLAAQGVAANDRYDLLSGPAALVDQVQDTSPPPTLQDPLPAPDRASFTLADLGFEDRTVRGYYAPTLSVPVRFDGDARARPGGGRLYVHFGYSAQLDVRLSTVEVRLNGVSLRSIGLEDPEGSEDEVLEVDVPADILRPDSRLDIVFHLFPRDFDPCRYVSDKMIWGTLYETTEIQAPMDHFARLPDLGKLRHRAWPFNLEHPQQAAVVVVPDAPNRSHASAVLQLGAELGRLSTADKPDLIVRTASAEAASPSAGRNRIGLFGDEANSWIEQQIEAGTLTARGQDHAKELNAGKELIKATVGTPYGTLEAARATGEDAHNILVLRTPGATELASMVRLVFDERKVLELDGNLAVLEPDGGIDTLDVANKVAVGKVPVVSAARFATRRNWLLVALIATIAAVLGTAIVREWAQRRSGEV